MPNIAWFGKRMREEEDAGSEGEEKEGSLVRRALIDQQGQSSEGDQEPTGRFGNEPFGSRSEPGIRGTRINHLLLSGEIPEGRARLPHRQSVHAHQRILEPVLEPGVTWSPRLFRAFSIRVQGLGGTDDLRE
jgi:hypothetical protein